MKASPEILAIRAVHQYRKRDILAYVSLRQYLRNNAALRDIWSDEIATALVVERATFAYNRIRNFKEVEANSGQKIFRLLQIPGPTEILAETALLAACAQAGGAFLCLPSVYSYHLSVGADEAAGVFKPYMIGFKARHAAIASACANLPGAVVIYTDIKKFYPSIKLPLALKVWAKACDASNLPKHYRTLGEKLLSDHGASCEDNTSPSILTGPMLSHLIGNLVLREIDLEMATHAPNGYFRYVDDVAIVASPAKALELEQLLRSKLGTLDLQLNENKRLETKATDWLPSANDFDDAVGISWKTFIGDMKRLLFFFPEQREQLTALFREHHIRIIPLDYSDVQQERGWLTTLQMLIERPWFKRSIRARASTSFVLHQALQLRTRYGKELEETLSGFERLEPESYERKRKLYRLRFLSARMTYLANPEDLPNIANSIAGILEMAMTSTVYEAIATGDVTNLMAYGPNAAQAAAQPLRAIGEVVQCGDIDWTKEEILQAYGVIRLNGLRFERTTLDPLHPMVRFCDWNKGSSTLYQSANEYFRELGCIHGVAEPDLNSWAVETAFDRDDDMVFDMQEVMQAFS